MKTQFQQDYSELQDEFRYYPLMAVLGVQTEAGQRAFADIDREVRQAARWRRILPQKAAEHRRRALLALLDALGDIAVRARSYNVESTATLEAAFRRLLTPLDVERKATAFSTRSRAGGVATSAKRRSEGSKRDAQLRELAARVRASNPMFSTRKLARALSTLRDEPQGTVRSHLRRLGIKPAPEKGPGRRRSSGRPARRRKW